MNITLLQIIVLISIAVILYMVIDAGKRNSLRIFHVIIFSGLLLGMGFVALKPEILTTLGQVVGVERGADFIVYLSII